MSSKKRPTATMVKLIAKRNLELFDVFGIVTNIQVGCELNGVEYDINGLKVITIDLNNNDIPYYTKYVQEYFDIEREEEKQ